MKRIKKVKIITPPYPFEAYTHIICPLDKDEGGGFLITFPDLPGCTSDGETMEEAIENGRDAFVGWISMQTEMKREIPKPEWKPDEGKTIPSEGSGKCVIRMPKSMHTKLIKRAKQEGASLNALVLSLVAEGIEIREDKERTAR